MVRCEACGAENRDRARFCIGCARPIAPIAPSSVPTAAGETKPKQGAGQALSCAACGVANGPGAALCAACGKALVPPQARPGADNQPGLARPAATWRWILVGAVVVALLAWGVRHLSTAPNGLSDLAMGPGGQVAGKGALTTPPLSQVPVTEAAAPGAVPTAVAAQDLNSVSGGLDRSERLVEREAPSATPARALAGRDQQQRQRRDDRRQMAPAAPNPPDAMAPRAANGAAAPMPQLEASVEKACSQASNILSRDLCRMQACRKPNIAGDPICVWYRQLESERRRQPTF
jgi:hypothetical protein